MRRHADAPDKRSPAEAIIWPHLEPLGFLCQYRTRGYILDFYNPQLRLAIEIDGARWHDSRKAYDLRRDERFADTNIVTIRVPARTVFQHTNYLAQRVAWICQQRKHHLCGQRVWDRSRNVRSGETRIGADKNDTGLAPNLMRQYLKASIEASDRVREFQRTWVSPFDTSTRGRIEVIDPA